MAAPVYATLDDLAQWLDDDLPISAPAVLRSAAYAVADRISYLVYRVDSTTGLPTNTDQVAALRDATCAQAAWLIANGIDAHSGTGDSAIEKSVKIGTAQIEYADADSAAASRAAGLSGLCKDAERIVMRAGFSNGIYDSPAYFHYGLLF